MAVKVPGSWEGEFRGAKPGGSFTNRQTGELIEFGPTWKFEAEDRFGDVGLVGVKDSLMQRLDVPLAASLVKGQRYRLVGDFVMGDGKDDRSYFQPSEIIAIDDAGNPVKASKDHQPA